MYSWQAIQKLIVDLVEKRDREISRDRANGLYAPSRFSTSVGDCLTSADCRCVRFYTDILCHLLIHAIGGLLFQAVSESAAQRAVLRH